jgi:branched-subunit amino acid aminotransferase/4-amino-4-deoxychorismate lyase
MTEPIAFLNGKVLPQSAAVLPVYDSGFVLGTTVAEQMRSFQGKLFRLREHLERLARSLAIVGVDLGLSLEELAETGEKIVQHNHRLLAPGDDLALVIFVTPGPMRNMAPDAEARPTICAHTYPLPFQLWSESYSSGERLVTTDVRQTPVDCWPTELKCRSRMHYFLADQAARKVDSRSRALMLDEQGFVTEATTANFVMYRQDEGILTPPRAKILPGITLSVLREITTEFGLTWNERDLRPSDVHTADEAYLVSTSPCVLPVVSFNGQPIGAGLPGIMGRRILSRWNEIVNVDVVEQAKRFSSRDSR